MQYEINWRLLVGNYAQLIYHIKSYRKKIKMTNDDGMKNKGSACIFTAGLILYWSIRRNLS